MFDENGYYIDDLGSPEDQATINQAEELFGVDLNEDGVQGVETYKNLILTLI